MSASGSIRSRSSQKPFFDTCSQFLLLIILFCCIGFPQELLHAQQLPWSQRMANTTVSRWPKGNFVGEDKPWVWNYELGVLLQGMDAVWYHTADGAYYSYIKASIDPFVNPDGTISTYKPENNALDDLVLGKELLLLYGVTQDARYYKAAALLREQLNTHPRTRCGWMGYTWQSLSMHSLRLPFTSPRISKTSPNNLF
jgi:unsaturated rhamnogalacturonyl hydrolase